jgi:hypothetical protein
MTPWFISGLAAVADATGNVTQLYPPSFAPGTGATTGGTVFRKPAEGTLVNMQVDPDGLDGGTIELYDINGADAGADVNTSNQITAAQLATLIAAGKARKMYGNVFSGASGARISIAFGTPFLHGLAARYINPGPTGTVSLTLIVDGGSIGTDHAL